MKTSWKMWTGFLLLAVFFSACGPKALPEVEYELREARTARKGDDWQKYARHLKRAVELAENEDLPPDIRTAMHYELGRVLGATCRFEEAEQHLLKALELDRTHGGPVYMDYTELARLQYDQNHFDRALPYFEQSVQSIEASAAGGHDPIGYSEVLLEYEEAARQTGDDEKAQRLHEQAMQLRKQNPGMESFTDRTPYGQHCN